MSDATEQEKLYAPFIKVRSAMIEWFAHCLVVAGLLLGIWSIELLTHKLWPLPPPGRMLFGQFPLSYIFDGADLGVLVAFLGYGGYCVVKAYMEKR